MNYILVDFESVHPSDISGIAGTQSKIKLFLGPHQKKIPSAIASALQPLGSNLEYISIETSGRNALDMVLSWTLGALCLQDPAGRFFIISKDGDYDPMILHLSAKNIAIKRYPRIADIPLARKAIAPAADERLPKCIDHLKNLKTARPATEKSLLSTLGALFKKELSPEDLSSIFERLKRRGVVKVNGKKLAYEFPDDH